MSKLPDNKLKNLAKSVLKVHKNSIGYPTNEKRNLNGFYKWIESSGLWKTLLNNVGNAFFGHHYKISSLEIERGVLEFLARGFGFENDELWGIITTSGTDGNNHGIYFGRVALERFGAPIMYVSEQAHYSNARLAHLQGIELRVIKCEKMGQMSLADFEAQLDESRPALVVCSVGTTFKGAIDDIKGIKAILERKAPPAIYLHIDAALFGGFLPFSEHSHLVDKKVLRYDSIAISGHKFFGIDEPSGVFLTTNEILELQKSFNVPYLDAQMPMISCSRSGLTPLKFYWIIKTLGRKGLANQAKTLLKNARYLKKCLDDLSYPAWMNECSNIVFFKRPNDEIMEHFQLAPSSDTAFGGELAHITIMQHVDKREIDKFIKAIKKSL